MAIGSKNPEVDFFFNKAGKWQEEYEKLRTIVLGCNLVETLKWGCPCYTITNGSKQSNIVLIHGFNEYCALLFFKGALMNDPNVILIQQTKNVQAARQVRFTNVKEILTLKTVLKTYIKNAIEVEIAGLKVDYKKTADFSIPVEFQNKLDEVSGLKAAFKSLTPGRQRAWLFYFSQPKQSITRASRVEKSLRQIFNGKGIND